MGNSNDTRKSLEEVKADLLKTLTDNARTALKQQFNITDNTSNLEGLLSKIAVNRFKSVYKYEYNDDASTVTPPDSLGGVRTSAKICSIVPPIGTQVNQYLEGGVFSKLDLPDWMSKTAMNDLANVANIMVGRDTDKQWLYQEYRRTYDARVEDQDTYNCNSLLVYCHGSLIEDGTQAELAIIYYCGVYYKTTSETKATRDRIQTSAYTGAGGLAGVTVPATDEKLKEALDIYTKTKFNSEFNFEYGTTPPDSYRAAGVESAFVTQNTSIYYIPDTTTEDLRNYIDHQVYSGINIPLDSVKHKASNDTYEQYKSVLNNASTESWNTTRLDKTYIPADPSLNPIRQTGLILSWYDHKTTDTQVSISVKYVYMITMFYECQNAEKELTQELFKAVCNNLRRHIQGDDGSGDITDMAALKKFMYDYGTQEFQNKFRFAYDGDFSVPPNKKEGGKVRGYEEFLYLDNYPATQDKVEDWMNAEVFYKVDEQGNPNKLFPPFAMAPIYDDIASHVMRYASDEVPKDNNWWYTADFRREYYDNEGKNRDIQQYAYYLYALGDMVLNKPGSGGQEGVKVKRMFVYYLGVFSSYVTDDWR